MKSRLLLFTLLTSYAFAVDDPRVVGIPPADAGRGRVRVSATVSIDGKSTGLTLPRLHESPNGISYLHFYNPAESTDPNGFSILATKAEVK